MIETVAIHDPFYIKKKKSVSGAVLDYDSLPHIPCTITSQGNNTGSIEPHCPNNKIIEEVSRRLVTHFPLTSSSSHRNAASQIWLAPVMP